MTAMRFYEPHELGADGYPPEWHETIRHLVREEAGHRCVRCGHPFIVGSTPGMWSPCDERCTHGGPLRSRIGAGTWLESESVARTFAGDEVPALVAVTAGITIEAKHRVLTVHHLDGVKANCRWWNLAALDQRCHLQIQGKVQMERVYPWEHSAWFRPYVAGYYAWTYLGEDLDRASTLARLDELLGLERVA